MGVSVLGILARACLGTIGLVYSWLPAWARKLKAFALGTVLFALGLRRAVIEKNLRRFLPGEDAPTVARRAQLLRAAYRHLAELTLEITMLFGPKRGLYRWAQRHERVEGYENWVAAQAQGKGVLFLSSHVGNWEIMAAVGGTHKTNLLLVTKRLKPAWFHSAIENGRLSNDVKGTYEPRTFRDVLSHLKAGGTVGIVLDQFAGPPVGVRVPLFGVPVGTHTVMAMVAKRTGAPVIPVVNYRLPDGRHLVRCEPALRWIEHEDAHEELALNTAQYVQVIERHIREAPEQWLWTHQRFKGDLSPLRDGEWREGRVRQAKPSAHP